MNFSTAFTALIAATVLSGCASTPKDPAVQASEFVSESKTFFQSGGNSRATDLIDGALNHLTGGAKVAEFFAQNKQAASIYLSHIQTAITNIASPEAANSVFDKLLTLKDSSVFPAAQTEDLFTRINTKVAAGNLDGSVPFRLGDNIMAFPHLKAPDQQHAMLSRSIKYLQSGAPYDRRLERTIDVAAKSGKNSADWSLVETSLPTMNIRRSELDAVAKVFPEFAALRLQQSTARVFVQLKNGDRLLADDMLSVFRQRIKGVEWVNSAGPGTTTVVIERIRNEERTAAERTESITYARHQVNFLSAALLMPNNASYIYEVISGGAEIEYGYGVSATSNNQTTYDDLVRGKVGGTYRRCQNARIQNVFGGVNSAGFIANDDMQSRCSGSQAVQIDDLRKEVFTQITSSVLKIPAIAAVHELN